MKRRTKGSGSVFPRGSTYWIEFQVRGQRVRESAHTSDRETAENYLKQRIGEVAAGGDINPSRATIGDLYRLVIADYKLRGLRDVRTVQWRYEAHMEKLLGNLPAARFGAHQVRQYVAVRRGAGASDSTINRELAFVRRGFVLGSQEDPPIVRRTPHIPKLEEGDPRQGFIERAQYEILLAHLPEHLKAALVLGYHYGFRLGEIRKLRWNQVDFQEGVIRLERGQTKGKTARQAPIYGEVREWLERQQTLCTGDRVFCWRQPAKRVEPKEKALGSHIKGWKAGCEAAGLPGLLFHDLRRSAVRNMVRAGISERVAMQISGHKTPSVFGRYNIVAGSDLEDAKSKMESFGAEQKAKNKLRRVK